MFASLPMNISLLCMFARSLRKVCKDAIAVYMREHAQDSTVTTNNEATSMDIVIETANEHEPGHAKKDSNAQEIVELHDLIKKFTTLVGIATSSSLTYLISIVLNWKVSFEFAGDHGLNMMCMWMLLGSSNKYWDWCKTYGLCKCCYR